MIDFVNRDPKSVTWTTKISSILGDETQVEQVKKEGIRREKKSMYSLLQEVFGRGHPLGWLCPVFTEASKERPSKQYIVLNISVD